MKIVLVASPAIDQAQIRRVESQIRSTNPDAEIVQTTPENLAQHPSPPWHIVLITCEDDSEEVLLTMVAPFDDYEDAPSCVVVRTDGTVNIPEAIARFGFEILDVETDDVVAAIRRAATMPARSRAIKVDQNDPDCVRQPSASGTASATD